MCSPSSGRSLWKLTVKRLTCGFFPKDEKPEADDHTGWTGIGMDIAENGAFGNYAEVRATPFWDILISFTERSLRNYIPKIEPMISLKTYREYYENVMRRVPGIHSVRVVNVDQDMSDCLKVSVLTSFRFCSWSYRPHRRQVRIRTMWRRITCALYF